MLNERQSSPTAFRVELWQRAQALGPKVRAQVAADESSVSSSDIDDLWANLLGEVALPIGSKGAFDAEAELWTDAQLASCLRTALRNDIIDERRRRTDGEGRTRIVGDAFDEIHEGLVDRSIFSSLRPPTPEDVVVSRARMRQHSDEVRDVVGVDAQKLVIAEAIGATVPEQRQLLKHKTNGPRQALQDRLTHASKELYARAQAALVWLWPEAWIRWVAGVIGGASGAVLSAGTAVKVAGAIALIGGAIGGAKAVEQPAPKPVARTFSLPPTAASSSTTSTPTAVAPVASRSSVAAATISGTERAAQTVRSRAAAAAAQRKREAAARRRAQARRRAAARAAERRRRRAAVTQTAPDSAAPPVTDQAASAAQTTTTASSGGSSFSKEFLPDGR